MAETQEEITSYATEASGSTVTTNDAAKILVHSAKSGDDLDTSSRQLPIIPTTLKTFDIFNDQENITPLLTDYISSHPIRQKAVERDIPNYSYTERTLGKLGNLWGKTTKSMEQQRLALSIADYRNKGRYGNLAGSFLPDQEQIKDDVSFADAQRRYDDLTPEIAELSKYDTDEDTGTDLALGVAQLGIQMITAPKANPKVAGTAATAAVAGSLFASPATMGASLLAAAPVGGVAAVTASSIEDNFRVTAGQIYQQAYLDNPRKAFIDEEETYLISLGAAAATSGLEYLQVGGLLKGVPAIKSVTRKGVIEALKRGERGTAVLVAAKLAGAAIKSGAEEFGQQVIQDVATQTAEGRNLEKGVGEKILIASTSKEAAMSFAVGALAAPTVHVVTSKAKTAYGHIVDMNEALGEAGAVDAGGGDGKKPPEPKQYRFIIQDGDIKKAAQAEKTADFITKVAATKYNEANPDLVDSVEKSISPEGYGYIHTDEMNLLTAQDQKLLQKWNSFTGQIEEGTRVVRLSNADVVALQRVNKDVANIYRSKPAEPSVKSHQAWLQKIDDNAQRVQQVMEGLGVTNRDMSELVEGEVAHRESITTEVKSFELAKAEADLERLSNSKEPRTVEEAFQLYGDNLGKDNFEFYQNILDDIKTVENPDFDYTKDKLKTVTFPQEEGVTPFDVETRKKELLKSLVAKSKSQAKFLKSQGPRVIEYLQRRLPVLKLREDLRQQQLNKLTSKPSDFSPVPQGLEIAEASVLNTTNDVLQNSLDSALEVNEDASVNALVNGFMDHIISREIPAIENSKLKSQFKTLDLNLTKRKLTDILVNSKQVILNTKISQLDPRQFAENARQYGKEASLALQNSDIVAYAHAKQLQLTNLQAIIELKQVRKGLNNFAQTVATLSDPETLRKLRTLNNKHADFIENVTSMFNTGERARLDRDAYMGSVQSLQDNNLPTVEVPEALFEATGIDPRELSVQQLQAVDAALKTSQSAAQNELTLFKNEEAKELNEVVEQLKVRLGTRGDANPDNYIKLESMLSETHLTSYKDRLKKIRNNLTGFIITGKNILLNNLPDIVKNDLDLGENNGYFTRLIYNPLIEASNTKSQLLSTFNNVLADVVNLYGVDEWTRLERTKVNFLGRVELSQAELIVMTSYLGTESSQKRLAMWLKSTIPDITAELEKYVSNKDVENIQKIVNFYSKIVLPKERALNQRMAIPPLKEIEALPFAFSGKNFKGGYLPLNTMADYLTKANREGTTWVENVRAGKVKAYVETHDRTFDVHELNREASDLPIDLTMTGIRDSFDMRAHDLAYRETAHDLTKILTNKDNQRYLVNVLGVDKYATLHDTIQGLIGNRYGSEVEAESKIRWLTTNLLNNSVYASLGFNMKSVARQVQSLPLMIVNLTQGSGNNAAVASLSATRHILSAAASVLTNPVSFYQQAEFISKLDADFANKFRAWNKNSPDFLRLAKSFDPALDQVEDHRKWMITRGWQSTRQASMVMLSYVSLALNTIQWTAAYNMAMNGEVKNVKANQKDAALYASKQVRYSLERNEDFEKSDIQKMWFMKPLTFMTNQASVQGAAVLGQFNIANRMGKIDPATRKYMYTKAFAHGLFTVAMPAIVVKMLLGLSEEDKDKELEKINANPKMWLVKQYGWSMVDTLPLVSQLSYMAQGRIDYGNPMTDAAEGVVSLFRAGSAVLQGEEPTKEESRKAKKFVAGPLLGIPFNKTAIKMYDAIFGDFVGGNQEYDPVTGKMIDTGATLGQSPETDELANQSVWSKMNMLWNFGKKEMMDAGSESIKGILDGMKEDALNMRSPEEKQNARNAEIRTSQRGYLMNPEFQKFTRYYDNGNTETLSLSADEEKDWEVYLDTIGRKETGNYTKLKNPESSASGYMQILDGTVNGLANLYPQFRDYKDKSAIDLPTDIQFAMGRTLLGERYPDLRQVKVESQVDRFTLWYLASHVLRPIAGDKILEYYSAGKLNKPISYLISKAELDSNPVLFGKASDKLTLEKVLDRVKNGYEFKGKTIRGIRDYLELAQEDADKGIGKLK